MQASNLLLKSEYMLALIQQEGIIELNDGAHLVSFAHLCAVSPEVMAVAEEDGRVGEQSVYFGYLPNQGDTEHDYIEVKSAEQLVRLICGEIEAE